MKRRFLFKVLLSAVLIVLVSGTFSTGIIQVELDINQFFYHKAFAYVFLASIVIHLVINRKALRAYFRRHTAAKPIVPRSGQPPTAARPPAAENPPAPFAASAAGAAITGRRRMLGGIVGGIAAGLAVGAPAGWGLALRPPGAQDARSEREGSVYDPSLRYHLESRLGLAGVAREISLRVFHFFRRNAPPLYKRYEGRPIQPLPAPALDAPMTVGEAIQQRRSRRAFGARPISLTALSDLLFQAAGITGYTSAYGRADYALRAAPSSGAKYPVEIYLLAHRVESLEPGLYHYQSEYHGLVSVRRGEFARDFAQRALAQEFLAEAAVVFILTGYFARSASRYGSRAYRYVALDAGHIGENLYLAATAQGLSVTGVGAFLDDQVNEFLDIDGRSEAALYLNAVGHPEGMA